VLFFIEPQRDSKFRAVTPAPATLSEYTGQNPARPAIKHNRPKRFGLPAPDIASILQCIEQAQATGTNDVSIPPLVPEVLSALPEEARAYVEELAVLITKLSLSVCV
jgi:hypothetical protein